MIDFTKLTGIEHDGKGVTQIEDSNGSVLWAVKKGTKAVLTVMKLTKDTYAGETAYTGEKFAAIDVYPVTNGVVKVTYGGLTKTISDKSGESNPNAHTVYFGTMYGEPDAVETPDSGELVIEGGFAAFGRGTYQESGKYGGSVAAYCACITDIEEFGEISHIPDGAFRSCSITKALIPNGVESIGANAFRECTALTRVSMPDSVKAVCDYAFNGCTSLTDVIISNGVESIGANAFQNCDAITNLSIPGSVKKIGSYAFQGMDGLSTISLSEGLQEIDAYAFDNCKNVSYLVVPASVKRLGARSLYTAHMNSNNIYAGEFHLRGTTPPECETKEVGSYTYTPFTIGGANANMKIYIPRGYMEVYKNSSFSNKSNLVEES